ncbi:MAG: hypothetical protein HYU52_13310 [Acidobacteria bacterium]|nr:hypothetical protein [Acidobacteriota bacterium]
MQELELSTIRRFVLGDLDDETRRSIESEALENDALFERIEAVEDELLEEYIAGDLPGSERKILEETLDTVPGRSRRAALMRALAGRSSASREPSAVAELGVRARYANQARFAIAAAFATAAVAAIAFFQLTRSEPPAAPPTPTASATPAASDTETLPAPNSAIPVTSSALAAHRPDSTLLAARKPQPPHAPSVPVVTFLLVATTSRSESAARKLIIDKPDSVVDLQIAIDDDEFSHYNVELRAPDGTTLSTHRDIPVSALLDAPVIRVSVPASSLRSGRHELVLAGVHERGTEEIAYLEFDVVKR